ncbi:MAG: GNAT family N-acetyltransferase [Methanobacteriota archaeon]
MFEPFEGMAGLRRLLDKDPVMNGILIHKIFSEGEKYKVWTDGNSVVAVRGRHAMFCGDWNGAEVPFHLLPKAPFWSSGAPFGAYEQVRRRYVMDWKSPCWTLVAPMPKRPNGGWENLMPLRQKDAPTVARLWSLHDHPLPHIRECIKKYPSACIRVDGELASWGGNHFVTDKVAELGFAHTLRKYRRMGFGNRITIDLTHRLYGMDLTPYCYVFKTNEASYEMCKGAGFEERGDVAWFGAKRLKK